MPLVDLVDDLRQDVADRLGALAPAEALLRDLEDLLLGAVDQLASGLALVVEDGGGDLRAGLDELPQERSLPDDIGISADIGGGGRIASEGTDVCQAADGFQLRRTLQLL